MRSGGSQACAEEVSVMDVAAVPTTHVEGRRFFSDLSVKIKILAAVGVASLVALIVGVVGLLALQNANTAAQGMYTGSVASIKAITAVHGPMLRARLDLANHVLSADRAK